jgi:formiminoglutamase
MSNNNMSPFTFIAFQKETIDSFVSTRDKETKIGQNTAVNGLSDKIQYIILGIEEDMGPQANGGLPGSKNGFKAFLQRFLNMQANRFLSGENVSIIGKIQQEVDFSTIENAREHIKKLDELVVETLRPYVEAGKIPIVIGGGHNNAYPLIKTVSSVLNEKMQVVNLDPHADCRAEEGRHSGNPFSYAKSNGFLEDYTVLGLHKAYNSEYLLAYLDSNEFQYTFFDDYIGNPELYRKDILEVAEEQSDSTAIGIELDLDSIQYMPSSAFSPSGISIEDARFYVRIMGSVDNVRYLHLPEGAPKNSDEEKVIGKTLAYLVWEFLHAQTKID